jgi:hypothetical protein
MREPHANRLSSTAEQSSERERILHRAEAVVLNEVP